MLWRQRRQFGGLHRAQGFPVEHTDTAVTYQGDLGYGSVPGNGKMHGARHHGPLAEPGLPGFPVPCYQPIDPGHSSATVWVSGVGVSIEDCVVFGAAYPGVVYVHRLHY